MLCYHKIDITRNLCKYKNLKINIAIKMSNLPSQKTSVSGKQIYLRPQNRDFRQIQQKWTKQRQKKNNPFRLSSLIALKR